MDFINLTAKNIMENYYHGIINLKVKLYKVKIIIPL